MHTKILTHLNECIPCPARCTLAGQAFAVAPSGRLYPRGSDLRSLRAPSPLPEPPRLPALALTGELGCINATLCEIEESFITAADQVASTLLAEQCPSFLATYYQQRYSRAAGSTLTR